MGKVELEGRGDLGYPLWFQKGSTRGLRWTELQGAHRIERANEGQVAGLLDEVEHVVELAGDPL